GRHPGHPVSLSPRHHHSRRGDRPDRGAGLFRLPRREPESSLMRVGIEASIDDALLDGFAGLEMVRIPAEPDREIAVDFWVAALAPPNQRKHWPHLKGVQAVQGVGAGGDWLRRVVPAGVPLCSARGVHDGPTAEWAVTATLAMQKYLPFYAELQRRADWAGKDKAEDIYLLSEGAKRE